MLDLKIMLWSVVSGKPPLLDVIVAHPFEDASNAVLPNGSSHLEGTTAISDLPKKFKTLLWSKNPSSLCCWCLIIGLSLLSSPIEKAFQSLCLFRIFIIASPKISYPLAAFNFPTKVIYFFFF